MKHKCPLTCLGIREPRFSSIYLSYLHYDIISFRHPYSKCTLYTDSAITFSRTPKYQIGGTASRLGNAFNQTRPLVDSLGCVSTDDSTLYIQSVNSACPLSGDASQPGSANNMNFRYQARATIPSVNLYIWGPPRSAN